MRLSNNFDFFEIWKERISETGSERLMIFCVRIMVSGGTRTFPRVPTNKEIETFRVFEKVETTNK